jgi:hypothetical protein
MEGDTAHFLMVTFWESEEAIRAFAGDDISVAKYYDFDKDFLIGLEPCSHSTGCTTIESTIPASDVKYRMARRSECYAAD